MQQHVGTVKPERARQQWSRVVEVYRQLGREVFVLDGLEGSEDMVFCANPSFSGITETGKSLTVVSRMNHDSRQREVAPHQRWFETQGVSTTTLDTSLPFEGGGDAIWHPQRALLWGGWGFRTHKDVYSQLSDLYQVPVLRLELRSENFYHLDTCLCALDETTVLIDPTALTEDGLQMIHAFFSKVLMAPPREAVEGLAVNAVALPGGHVVIDQANVETRSLLEEHGYTVHPVDTSEFRKSGGSVYCMKAFV